MARSAKKRSSSKTTAKVIAPRKKKSVEKRVKKERATRPPTVGAHEPIADVNPPQQSPNPPQQPYVRLSTGHPPQTIDDLPWPVSYRKRLARFVENGRGGNLLFAGWPGTGKTEAARLIIRSMNLDEFRVDAANDTTLDKLQNAKRSAQSQSLLGDMRAVIIDEADSYGQKALQSLRGDTMNDPENVFIIICNDLSKIPEAVQSRCEKFVFDRNDHELLREVKSEQQRRARDILETLGVEYTDRDITAAWSDAKGDFREALRALEGRINGGESLDQDNDQGPIGVLDSVTPPVPDLSSLTPDQRETAELFYKLKSEFERYLVLPKGGSSALATFVMHAYVHDTAPFSPILALTSPRRACGKSEAMEMLRILIEGAISTVSITPAATFERAEAGTTLLFDEADRYLTPGSDFVQLLNGGVKKSTAMVYRANNKSYRVWCPKVIAYLGRIRPDTLASRCINIRMLPPAPQDKYEKIPFDQDVRYEGLREQCFVWAEGALSKLKAAKPPMPDGFFDRRAEKWYFLFAIADLAGDAVGMDVREAAMAIEKESDFDEEDIGTQLLEDIRNYFETNETSWVFSSDLVEDLRRRTDRVWASWPRDHEGKVARILSDYNIRPASLRRGGKRLRGYERWWFEDIFQRFLPARKAS